ncbi:MAG TPA: ABC transporter substrate-binding protein, partial [Candidatus Binatus sp.]|nr:ABC transporter substrate-binding protein [Candidatus Binatus sp.]
ARAAIVETLQRSAPQPEILTFDLEGDPANAAAVLAHVHRADPILVVTIGSLATGAVIADSWTVPVVFSMVLYPAQSGFASSGGRRVTGASLDLPLDLQFGLLHRLLPRARRLGVLYNAAETGPIVEEARAAASRHGFVLEAAQVDGPPAAVGALSELLERVDAVWTVADSHVFTPQTTSGLILAALRRRIPMIGLSTVHVRSGALAAFSCDYADVGAQAGELAVRVLRGESAAAIPPTSPRKVTIALNLRTAQHLGIDVPADIERQAGEVFR